MKYKSTRYGEWPTGTHWTPGKVREIAGADADMPDWLKPVAEKKAKASKATKKPEPSAPAGE